MNLLICGVALLGTSLSSILADDLWTTRAPNQATPFETEIVSRPNTEESVMTVSPDGSEIFWGVSERWFPMSRVSAIWTASRQANGWGPPHRVSFSRGFSDGDPFISYDGKAIYFVSMRPVRGPRKDFDIYVTERTADGWGPARNLGSEINSAEDELYPSVAPDGTIYFASERSGQWQIYSATKRADGSYDKVEALSAPVNIAGVWSFNPFILLDGKTLVFTSLNRPGGYGIGDLWVSRMTASGTFETVRNLGPLVNSKDDEFHPSVSPDGKALFFVRRPQTGNADVHWISSRAVGL